MSLLASLAHIGLSRQDLQNLETENLIRLEKKLIAEQRLNGSITKNDVDQVMRLIKTYPHEIKTIAGYECLWGILNGVETERIGPIKYHKKEELERLRQFVSVQFKEELLKYITLNLNADNWNNLRVLWHYRCFLTKDIIDTLKGKAEDRMEYAITLLNEYLSDAQLCQKLAFLQSQDLYTLLSQLDERLFNAIVYQLLTFVKQNRQYISENSFFSKMGAAIKTYETTNATLTREIRDADFTLVRRWSDEPESVPLPSPPPPPPFRVSGGVIAGAAVVVAFILFIVFRASSGSSKGTNYASVANHDLVAMYHPEMGTAMDTYNHFLPREYFWLHDYVVQMHAFAEARMFPLNYPIASWNTPVMKMTKYFDPFTTKAFIGDYRRITNIDGPKLYLFNQTDNECVVLAYYGRYFEQPDLNVFSNKNDEQVNAFALYLPPHDSLSIDARMARLRFYMGKRMSRFSVSEDYRYADSLDAKFSKFTHSDSMLFSKAFEYGSADSYNEGSSQSLTIAQPNAYTYQINWTGKLLMLYQDNSNWESLDSSLFAGKGKPMTLNLRKMPYDVEQNKAAKIFLRNVKMEGLAP